MEWSWETLRGELEKRKVKTQPSAPLHFLGPPNNHSELHKDELHYWYIQDVAEIVKLFKILFTRFSARVSRSAGI
jgi:hypothetical protein